MESKFDFSPAPDRELGFPTYPKAQDNLVLVERINKNEKQIFYHNGPETRRVYDQSFDSGGRTINLDIKSGEGWVPLIKVVESANEQSLIISVIERGKTDVIVLCKVGEDGSLEKTGATVHATPEALFKLKSDGVFEFGQIPTKIDAKKTIQKYFDQLSRGEVKTPELVPQY